MKLLGFLDEFHSLIPMGGISGKFWMLGWAKKSTGIEIFLTILFFLGLGQNG
jgi:hypothetical protein